MKGIIRIIEDKIFHVAFQFQLFLGRQHSNLISLVKKESKHFQMMNLNHLFQVDLSLKSIQTGTLIDQALKKTCLKSIDSKISMHKINNWIVVSKLQLNLQNELLTQDSNFIHQTNNKNLLLDLVLSLRQVKMSIKKNRPIYHLNTL